MALDLPQLDDRDFEHLRAAALELIPRQFPSWTDRNLSDPGITLVELFAFLIDAAHYQIDRVPDRMRGHFAALAGLERVADEPLDALLARTYADLRRNERPVTETDAEALVRREISEVARVEARLHQRPDPSGLYPPEPVLRVVVLPLPPSAAGLAGELLPSDELRHRVFAELQHRRLLAGRFEIPPPRFRPVEIEVDVVKRAGRVTASTVAPSVEQAVRRFLDALEGGVDGNGWRFGRPLYRSELFAVLEVLPGVDHVEGLRFGPPGELTERDRFDAPGEAGLFMLPEGHLHVTVRAL